jgi:hypothetical protein
VDGADGLARKKDELGKGELKQRPRCRDDRYHEPRWPAVSSQALLELVDELIDDSVVGARYLAGLVFWAGRTVSH